MYYFIGGPPTAGKSHLAKKFISNSNLDIKHVEIDKIRDSLKENDQLKKWVDFFRSQDEEIYWQKTSCKEHMDNVVIQSEALWPHILEKIFSLKSKNEHIIFEGVQILPHLARKYLDFNGIYLLATDIETIYIRLLAHKRWGETKELKRKEAECFYKGDTYYFRQKAKEYGYKVFNNIEEANIELAKVFI